MSGRQKPQREQFSDSPSRSGCCAGPLEPQSDFTNTEFDEPAPDASNEIRSVSRVYSDALRRADRSKIDPREFKVQWNDDRDIQLKERVGQGHFSVVYKAFDAEDPDTPIVAKVLKKAGSRRRITHEIQLLEFVRGGPNVVELLDTVSDKGKDVLLFEFVDYVPHEKLYGTFDVEDVQFYGYQLLRALDYTHSRGVMHRDVKPSNVLYDPTRRVLRLADWGVAGFYFPGAKNIRGPGTRTYKAPEMALRWDYYDYAVDMWAFGLLFACMIFNTGCLVRGRGGWFNQLRGIAEVVGVNPVLKLMHRLQITISSRQEKVLRKVKQVPLSSRITSRTRRLCTDQAMSVLAACLTTDPADRPTAREAMAYPFFAKVATESATASSGSNTRAKRRRRRRSRPSTSTNYSDDNGSATYSTNDDDSDSGSPSGEDSPHSPSSASS